MKHCIILLALLVSIAAPTLFAQSLTLFDVDASAFPTMTAKFYAFNADGTQARPAINELTLKENGIVRTITNVSCPPEKKRVVSMCIMVDTYKYIDLARSGTERLIGFLNMPNEDEVAITYMDRMASIWQDFTKDRAKAIEKSKTIPDAPGVDVNTMFYSDYSGGIPMIQNRTSDKKVLVLVSDLHCPNLNINESQLIADAKRDNISIYTVLLGTTDYSGLFKRIAEGTSGKVYENVKNVTDIEDVFSTIARLENNEACEITWQGDNSCNPDINVELGWQSQRNVSNCVLPSSAVAALDVKPNFIALGGRLPATTNDTTITLAVQNSDFTITAINRRSGSPDFTVINTNFPLFIPKNTNSTIQIRFTPSDSSMKYASFEVVTDKCAGYFSVNGGFLGKGAKLSSLKLTKPNGGESYVAGSDTVITWEGVSPSDTVRLEYSIDNGSTWRHIANNVAGLEYRWSNVPLPTSSQCLMRVVQGTLIGVSVDSIRTLMGHTDFVLSAAFSPDGSILATGSRDNTIRLWDVSTGQLVRSLVGHTGWVHSVAFSPNGNLLASGSHDNTIKLWNTATGAEIRTFTGHTLWIQSVVFSPDGNLLASGSADKTAKIWNISTGQLLHNLGSIGLVNGVVFSPDGTSLAAGGSDNIIKLWNTTTGTEIRTLTGHSDIVQDIAFSIDGSLLASCSADKSIKLWNVSSGNIIYTLTGHQGVVHSVAFNPEVSLIASGSRDNTIKLWDIVTGKLIYTIVGHRDWVQSVAFSPDGKSLVSGSDDMTAKIWNIDISPLQQDQSDAVFSIIAPEAKFERINIDMGKVLVGASKDTMVASVLCNRGVAPLHVLGVDVTNGNTSEFIVPRGAGEFYLQPGECRDMMFAFMPNQIGIRTARITVRTTIGNYTDTIRIQGEGIRQTVEVQNKFIDFGKVTVGNFKDSLQSVTIRNNGSVPITIDKTIYKVPNSSDFITLTGGGSFTLGVGETKLMNLRFAPVDVGRTSGAMEFHYADIGSPAVVQLFGEGIAKGISNPSITSTANIIYDSVCVGKSQKQTVTITNNGTEVVQLIRAEWITNAGTQYSTVVVPTQLEVDSSVQIDVDFTPKVAGLVQSTVRWIADKDTSLTVLAGVGKICGGVNPDTARTTVIVEDIAGQPGERVSLNLVLMKQSGLQLAGAPTQWSARVHYNPTILNNESGMPPCGSRMDSCALELSGTYNATNSELISIPMRVTLGNTDNAEIVIDEFRWTNGGITSEVVTQNGHVRVTGLCEEGGVRLVIPTGAKTSLLCRPNPAKDAVKIEYGIIEPLSVTIEVLNLSGQVVSTLVQGVQQQRGLYIIQADISTLSSGVYYVRMTTASGVLTSRLDVVR